MDALKYDSDLPVQYIPIQAITIPVIAGSNLALTGDALLCGYNFIENTGGAPATLALFDGQDVTGQQIAVIALSPGQTVVDALPFPGVYLTRGLFISVQSGSVQGNVWIRDV